jgi:hypothetical protein
MTASSSCRKPDPGDDRFDDINRFGVWGDEGWAACRRLGRTDDPKLDAILFFWGAYFSALPRDVTGKMSKMSRIVGNTRVSREG